MARVNEGSTSYHALAFYGADGLEANPEAIRYRLTADGGAELIPWTALGLDCRLIEISAELNTIGGIGAKRYLIVEATHNGGDKITQELGYTIFDLRGI